MKLNYCLTLDEIVDYNFPLDKPFYLEVNHENITYDLIVRLSSFDEGLICCGSNAHLRTEKTKNGEIKKPPFFDRWTWYKYFDESFIAYADPSFYYGLLEKKPGIWRLLEKSLKILRKIEKYQMRIFYFLEVLVEDLLLLDLQHY